MIFDLFFNLIFFYIVFNVTSNTFLAGISCYDGLKKEFFLLRAHVLSWSGDTPGLTKLMYLTGHNSYKGCRFCNIRGTYFNHVYFPTMPPMGMEDNNETYDPENLPLRTHGQFKNRISQLNQQNSAKKRKNLEVEFGIHKLFLCYC